MPMHRQHDSDSFTFESIIENITKRRERTSYKHMKTKEKEKKRQTTNKYAAEKETSRKILLFPFR